MDPGWMQIQILLELCHKLGAVGVVPNSVNHNIKAIQHYHHEYHHNLYYQPHHCYLSK